MTRPTKEQLEQARVWLHRVAEFPSALPGVPTHARVLLAATAEPTDEELRIEAGQYFDSVGVLTYTSVYAAGARREGAQ